MQLWSTRMFCTQRIFVF